MIHYLVMAALLAAPAVAVADTASAFGCSLTDTQSALPSVEGKDGTFYRVQADLRMGHPMEDPVIARMAALSQALAAGGTTLIYVTIPTKAQVLPGLLPPAAADYQFDSPTARLVYEDIIARLTAKGIVAPDLLTALAAAKPGDMPFFKTDFHWTATGARLAAQAIAAEMKAQPFYAQLPKAEYRTTEGDMTASFSTMRRILQAYCKKELPRVEAKAEVTTKTTDPAAKADIFAGDQAPQIVLVGTSFSDAPLANFAGYLSQESGLDVLNYAVTGGNQFGAITSYLISRDFAATRPRFLVWENPIYNNLGQFGPDPMEELVAAASAHCTTALPTTISAPDTLTADLSGLDLQPSDSILADLGADGGRRADFRFVTASGITRTAMIQRSERMQGSGRFFKSLETLWHPDLKSLSVTFDHPVSADTSLSLCRSGKEPS
jgi:alginate biosynthesis protein AlgX